MSTLCASAMPDTGSASQATRSIRTLYSKHSRTKACCLRMFRFQISLPLVNSVVSIGTFPTPGDIEKVRPGYEAALAAEIKRIVEELPQSDIALQWDCSWEVTDMYGSIKGLDAAGAGALERNIGQIERLSRIVPDPVKLGIHFCFGTFGGWPRFAPDSLDGAVDLANASLARAGRRSTGSISQRSTPSMRPFTRRFSTSTARRPASILGLIHNMNSFRARLSVARKFSAGFRTGGILRFRARASIGAAARFSKITSKRSRSPAKQSPGEIFKPAQF